MSRARIQAPSRASHIEHPLILLSAIPLLAVLLFLQLKTFSGISRGRMWTAFLLRATIFNLILLALAGLQVVIERDSLSVLFALDCSRSVPVAEQQRAIDFIRKSLPAKTSNDEAGLLVFGGRAMLENPPGPLFSPPDAKNIKSVVNGDATDIAQSLRISMSHLSESARRRVVLFTDGGQTTGDAAEALKRVVSMGADVWIVPLSQGNDAEMLIDKIVIPNELMWEQPFDAHVFVYSNISATARVRLYPGDKPGDKAASSYEKTVELIPGKNRVTFAGLRMHSGGAKEVRAVLEPLRREDDTLSENNEAYAFTDVQTDNRVLIMTSDVSEVKYLLAALEDQKMTIDVRSGATLPENPEAYRAYDSIVLANLARGFLSEQQMAVIRSCVEDQGAGLVMIGGDQSFGAGGYLGTPIEKVLPVDMDLLNQKIMPAAALVIVIDNSGSMGESVAGSPSTKQELANKAAAAAIGPLTDRDYLGVVSFDEEAHTVVGLSRNTHPDVCRGLIKSITPGGGTNIFSGLSAAADMLDKLEPNQASLRHVVLLTDGEGSGGDVEGLARAMAAKHITLTTIGVGDEHDARLLKQLASLGGGRYLPVMDPKRLPQVLVKEAALIRKSLIRSDERGIPISLGAAGPTLRDFNGIFPNVRAFVMTAAKPMAEVQLQTLVDGEKLPILVSWQHGLGKAVAFTSDATNRWAPDWVQWTSYKQFWTNMFTWVSRQRMPSNHTITTRVDGGIAHVTVEGIDAAGGYLNFAKLTGSAIEPGVSRGEDDARSYDLNFSMTAPGQYEAVFPVTKPGAYSITVIDESDPKRPNTIVTGLANSYSAEFAHQDGNDTLLRQMGEIATGVNTVDRLKDLSKLNPMECGLFAHDMPPGREYSDLFWPLIVLALCLFPFDVAVRRLAIDPEIAIEWALIKLAAGVCGAAPQKTAVAMGRCGFVRRKQSRRAASAGDRSQWREQPRRAKPV